MNCPYCAKEMESGYLRGGSGYELLWTEEPFKMTSLPTGNDFFVCKASDVYRPIAYLCRTCGKIVLDIKKIKKRAADLSTRGAFRKNTITQHSPHRGEQDPRAPPQFAARRRQTGSGTSCRIFCPTGSKTGPQYPNRRKILHPLPAAFSALQAENRRKRRRLSRPQTRNNLNRFF